MAERRTEITGRVAVVIRIVLMLLLAMGAVWSTSLAVSGEAHAQSAEEQRAIVVLQPKPVLRTNRLELRPRFTAQVANPLIHQYALAGSLGFSFSERVSVWATGEWWDFGDFGGTTERYGEVVRATATIPELVVPRWYAGADVTLAPVVGKFSFFNRAIVFWDMYGLLGAGLMEATRDMNPAVSLGVGGNLYMNRWLSLNIEYRDRISIETYSATDSIHHLHTVSAGIGIQIPFNFRYEDERGGGE